MWNKARILLLILVSILLPGDKSSKENYFSLYTLSYGFFNHMNIQPNKKNIHDSCWVFLEADPKRRKIFMYFIEKWSQETLLEKWGRTTGNGRKPIKCSWTNSHGGQLEHNSVWGLWEQKGLEHRPQSYFPWGTSEGRYLSINSLWPLIEHWLPRALVPWHFQPVLRVGELGSRGQRSFKSRVFSPNSCKSSWRAPKESIGGGVGRYEQDMDRVCFNLKYTFL